MDKWLVGWHALNWSWLALVTSLVACSGRSQNAGAPPGDSDTPSPRCTRQAQPFELELENNFLDIYNIVTGQQGSIDANLDDNMRWLQEQGYTHLRYFGIFPTGAHTFPSPTLDANGYPSNAFQESRLPQVIAKAHANGIVVSFDGLEIISESNRGRIDFGADLVTEAELAEVVRELVALGVDEISDEQFAGTYLEAIQSVTEPAGVRHETSSELWWNRPGIADTMLGSVFNFYTVTQDETTVGPFPPSNLGNLHIALESSHYYGVPFSVAVGSFGTLAPENWKNVLLFAQIQHHPERFSIEEQDTNFTTAPSFNLWDHVGQQLADYGDVCAFDNRPIANLVIDLGQLPGQTQFPTYNGGLITRPAVATAFAASGYRVIFSVEPLPEAEIYFLLLVGGDSAPNVVPLPTYVEPLLQSGKPVFLQPTYGIPDANDDPSWAPVHDTFGLPAGDTATATGIPATVDVGGYTVTWAGPTLWLQPITEILQASTIQPPGSVAVSAQTTSGELALIVQNGNRYLINSNLLHLEAAYVLSTLIGGPIERPCNADIAIVSDMALIFAEYDTDIAIALPWTGKTWRTQYGPDGTRVASEVIAASNRYTDTLSRGELVVLRGL